MSLVESQIREILEREESRLPIEELKATGPGPEPAYTMTYGRRIRRDCLGEPGITLVQRIGSFIELIGEEIDYIKTRMAIKFF